MPAPVTRSPPHAGPTPSPASLPASSIRPAPPPSPSSPIARARDVARPNRTVIAFATPHRPQDGTGRQLRSSQPTLAARQDPPQPPARHPRPTTRHGPDPQPNPTAQTQ